ncbi:hypothetical protein AAC387_Pa10g1276 [Persea americana]
MDQGTVRAQDMGLVELEVEAVAAEAVAVAAVVVVAVLGWVRALDMGPGMDPEVDMGNPHGHEITIPPK